MAWIFEQGQEELKRFFLKCEAYVLAAQFLTAEIKFKFTKVNYRWPRINCLRQLCHLTGGDSSTSFGPISICATAIQVKGKYLWENRNCPELIQTRSIDDRQR